MIFTIRVLSPFPQLGLHPGNLVTVEPGAPPPWHSIYVHRPLPANYGAIVALLEDGVGEIISPEQSVTQLAQAVGWPHGPPLGPLRYASKHERPLRPRAHLLLEK